MTTDKSVTVDRAAEKPTVYLVDGTSNIFRAYHAIRELRNSRGMPTNAVYGFTTMLRKLLKIFMPTHLAVAFDLEGPTFRHQAYEQYKANRPEPPEDLIMQIPYVRRVCDVLRVPTAEAPGFEADDVIATLAAAAHDAGFRVVVVASDKDLLQLVGDEVQIYNPVSEKLLDSAGVEAAFGVLPHQVADVLALWGDSSDNIPGVPGIGEKGAKDLIRRFGDLESTLRAAGSVQRKSYREGLQAHAAMARMCRELATLRIDAPVRFDPDAIRLLAPDAAEAHELFRDLEFSALASEFAAPLKALPGRHEVIVDANRLAEVVASLRAGRTVGIHLERDHPEPMRAAVVGLTLAAADGAGYYIPLAHQGLNVPRGPGLEATLSAIAPLLTDPAIDRVGHDVKANLVLLRRLGSRVAEFRFDSMIASYLLNPSRRSHAIDVVAEEIAGLAVPSYESIQKTGARRTPLADIDPERVAAVAVARLTAVVTIRDRMIATLESDRLLPLMTELELPLTGVLADVERRGVGIDVAFLESISRAWQKDLDALTARIHALAGSEFNINSPRQLAEVLFTTLKLQPGRRTRKTRSLSTGAEVLEELAGSHELPGKLLEYRSLQKLKSTYVDTLPGLVNPETGRVHTSFNQAVAATGRLSSSDPNLQNIPIRTELGRQIRRAFVPADGWVLLSADYSQIELRVLAELCRDPDLVDAFARGEDIHRRTAAELFGVMPELVSDEMRRRAKAVNFGIIYGMGPQRLARDQGIAMKEAVEFIRRYFERFPKVKEYIDGTAAIAEKEGGVRTLFQRVRYFPEIRGTDRNTRQQAIRAAVNTTIQGTAADLIKKAMVVLAGRLGENGLAAEMILQVHDELVLEVPADGIDAAASLVTSVMEGIHPLSVPLIVDLRVGPNWLEMRPLARSKD